MNEIHCHQKRFLASKYPQNAFSAGALPRTPLGSSQRSADPVNGLGEERGRERRGREEKGGTPKVKVATTMVTGL